MDSMKNIWLDGIMGVVVGDALGVPVEFRSREELASDPVVDMRGFGTYNQPKGTWSDDSSMMLATLLSLRENKGIDREDIMLKFAEWLNEGMYTPYGYAFDAGVTCQCAIRKFLEEPDTKDWGMKGDYSNGNGALMRIMPVVLYNYELQKAGQLSENEAVQNIYTVVELTHGHVRSSIGCSLYYFMAKAILDGEGELNARLFKGVENGLDYYQKRSDLNAELNYYKKIFNPYEMLKIEDDAIRSTGYVVETLEAAVWCLVNTNSYSECVLKAVNLGGDTDTIAAVAGGLAGLYYGYDGIPKEWVEVIAKREWIEEIVKGEFS